MQPTNTVESVVQHHVMLAAKGIQADKDMQIDDQTMLSVIVQELNANYDKMPEDTGAVLVGLAGVLFARMRAAMPAPSGYTAAGEPVFKVEDVAKAVGATTEDVVAFAQDHFPSDLIKGEDVNKVH